MNDSFSFSENETSVCLGRNNTVDITYNTAEVVIYSILCTLFCLLAFIGNTLVIAVIVKDPSINKHKQNLYLLSLAVADSVLAVTVIPFSLASELMGRWPFDYTYCRIYLSIDIALCTASIWSIAFIGLDRFASVKFPIVYRQYKSIRKIQIIIAAIWIYSIFVSLLPHFTNTELIAVGGNDCFINDEPWFIILSTALSFFVPACVIGPVYIGIYVIGRRIGSKAILAKSTTRNVNSNYCPKPSSQRSASDYSDSGVEMERRRSNGQYRAEHKGRTTLQLSFFKKPNQTEKHNELKIKEDIDSGTGSHHSNHSSRRGSIEKNVASSPNGSPRTTLAPSPTGSTGKMLCPPSLHKDRHIDGASVNVLPGNVEYRRRSAETLPTHSPNSENQSSFQKFFKSVRKSFNSSNNSRGSQQASIQIEIEPNTTSKSSFKRENTTTTTNSETRRKSSMASPGKISRRERRFIFIILLITGLFMLCWAPFFMTYLIYGICREACCVNVRFFKVAFYLGYLNSGVNPVIYTIFNKEFKLAFKRLLRWPR